MTAVSTGAGAQGQERRFTIHPLWVRLTHWINAIAVLMMMLSGWQIYNASPLFPFTFPPSITLGGWLAGSERSVEPHGVVEAGHHQTLFIHFAAMWLFAINGLIYLTLGVVSGRFRNKLFPISPRAVISDAVASLTFRLSHQDLSVYNAVQRLLYLGVILAAVIVALSGLAIWKPVQLQMLTAVFGGYDAARYLHFIAMATIAGFLVVHILLALLVPKSLRAMITGR